MTFYRLALCLTLTTSAGCGKNPSKPPLLDHELFSMFDFGRQVAASSAGPAFALTGEDEIVSLHSDFDSGYASWLVFDAEAMPSDSYANLPARSLDDVVTYEHHLGITVDELQPAANFKVQLSEDLVGLHYDRFFQGMEVRDAFLQLVYHCTSEGSCRLREIVNRSYGQISLANVQASPVDETEVTEGNFLAGWNSSAQPNPIVIARDDEGDGRLSFYRARAYEYTTAGTELAYTLTVPDGSAAPVEAYTNRLGIRYQLTGESHAKQGYIDNQKLNWPVAITPVVSGAQTVNTDFEGGLDLDAAPAAASLRLDSSRLRIINQANQIVSVPIVADGEGKLKIDTSTEVNFRRANAFSAIHRLIRFTKQFVTDTEIAILNQPTVMETDYVPQSANEPANCNAFFQPGNIGFIALLPAGGGCANVSLLPDVIYHEFGHGLDHTSGPAAGPNRVGIADGASSEAYGDITSLLMTGSPMLAPGFFLNDPNGLRNLEVDKVYPGDVVNNAPHMTGLIFGSTMFDLYTKMKERYGPGEGSYRTGKLFFRHMLATDRYLDAYQAILRLDDDDGNAATRSPNHCLINEVFAGHGLATAENCQDPAPKALVVDVKEIALSVWKESGTEITFMAAAPKDLAVEDASVSAVTLCTSALKDCAANGGTQIEFEVEGEGDDLVFFTAKEAITPRNLSTMNLIVWSVDEDGKRVAPMAHREFLWSAK